MPVSEPAGPVYGRKVPRFAGSGSFGRLPAATVIFDIMALMALAGQSRLAEAERMTRDVLADRRRVLGDDHPDTLASRATLAWLAAREGHRAEAEELYRQLLADRTRVLGASHPDTEATRNELGQLLAPSLGALARPATGRGRVRR